MASESRMTNEEFEAYLNEKDPGLRRRVRIAQELRVEKLVRHGVITPDAAVTLLVPDELIAQQFALSRRPP